MRLLIAEDDRMTADVLAKRFREEHYAVDVCYDGADAMRLYGSYPVSASEAEASEAISPLTQTLIAFWPM